MKSDKVEIVKKIVRQNNYHEYDRSYQQCMSLGIQIDRDTLSRFATKLELIDRAELVKKQKELHQIEQAQLHARAAQGQSLTQESSNVPLRNRPVNQPTSPKGVHRPSTDHPVHRVPHVYKPRDMTYEEVKQREAEITFELGELKIRESELLQELLSLSQMLDDSQFN